MIGLLFIAVVNCSVILEEIGSLEEESEKTNSSIILQAIITTASPTKDNNNVDPDGVNASL